LAKNFKTFSTLRKARDPHEIHDLWR